MFDLSSIIGEQINSLRPHFQSATERMNEFAGQVIERLDTIADAVENEDFTEQRVYIEGSTPGAATVDVRTRVPTSEEWELETVAVFTDTSDSVFRILGSPLSVGMGFVMADGPVPLFMARTFSGGLSYGGNKLMVQGNTDLFVNSVAPVRFRLQFKRHTIGKPKRTRAASSFAPQTSERTHDIDRTEVTRHTGTWIQGR